MSDLKANQGLETPGSTSGARAGPAGRGRRPLAGWLRMAKLFLLGVAVITVGGVLLLRPWAWRTYHVNMLIDLSPNRALLAKRLAREARAYKLEIELSSQPYGSLDAIELVDLPNGIDLALVPGGVARRARHRDFFMAFIPSRPCRRAGSGARL